MTVETVEESRELYRPINEFALPNGITVQFCTEQIDLCNDIEVIAKVLRATKTFGELESWGLNPSWNIVRGNQKAFGWYFMKGIDSRKEFAKTMRMLQSIKKEDITMVSKVNDDELIDFMKAA